MEDSLQTDPVSRRTLLRHIAAVSASAVLRPDSFIPRVEQFPDYLGVLGGAAPEQFSFSGGECYFNGQGPRKYAVAMFDANLLVPELLGTSRPDKDAARELMGTTSAQLVFNMGFLIKEVMSQYKEPYGQREWVRYTINIGRLPWWFLMTALCIWDIPPVRH